MPGQAKTLDTDVTGNLTPLGMKRLAREQIAFAKQHNTTGTVNAVFDAEKAHKAVALVIGPPDTPYSGGFFFFDMAFPDEYPLKPPKLVFKTTDGRVRFHPNLYEEGYVCLSILGTWSGPSWTTACTFDSVLLSIQSLLDSHPIQHEPGHEGQVGPDDVKYSRMITYETLNVAVCGVLENFPKAFECFREQCEKRFIEDYDRHVAACDKFQGLKFDQSPIWGFQTRYDAKALKQRLGNLRSKILKTSPTSMDSAKKTKSETKSETKTKSETTKTTVKTKTTAKVTGKKRSKDSPKPDAKKAKK
jgi:ubiquitin-protein ligase